MIGEDVWMYVLDPDAKTPNDLMWREYYNPVSPWLAVWKKIISKSFHFFVSNVRLLKYFNEWFTVVDWRLARGRVYHKNDERSQTTIDRQHSQP